MERPEYYAQKAEDCITSAYDPTPPLAADDAPMIQAAAAMRSSYVAEAQVYATLALAATQVKVEVPPSVPMGAVADGSPGPVAPNTWR